MGIQTLSLTAQTIQMKTKAFSQNFKLFFKFYDGKYCNWTDFLNYFERYFRRLLLLCGASKKTLSIVLVLTIKGYTIIEYFTHTYMYRSCSYFLWAKLDFRTCFCLPINPMILSSIFSLAFTIRTNYSFHQCSTSIFIQLKMYL